MTIDEHREQTINEIKELLKTNRRVACVRPTGYGKTYFIMKRLIRENPQPTLILVPRKPLLQTHKSIFKEFKHVKVTTYQSLMHKSKDQIKDMYGHIKYIYYDEFHRILAPKWLPKLKLLEEVSSSKIIGMSATPIRGDNKDVAEIHFDAQCTPCTLIEAIDMKLLPELNYIKGAYLSIEDVIGVIRPPIDNKEKEIDRHYIEKIIELPPIFKRNIPKSVLKGNLKVIMFVPHLSDIPTAKELCIKWFSQFNKPINLYDQNSSLDYSFNKSELEEYRKPHDNAIDIIINRDMLVEGLHLPEVKIAILLRKTQSQIVYYQQIGRAINQDSSTIFDLVANIDNILSDKIWYNQQSIGPQHGGKEKVMYNSHIRIVDETVNLVEYLQSHSQFHFLSESDKEFMRNNTDKTVLQISKILNRGVTSIYRFAKSEGLTFKCTTNYLTQDEINYIEANIKIKAVSQIAKDLGRATTVICDYLKRVGKTAQVRLVNQHGYQLYTGVCKACNRQMKLNKFGICQTCASHNWKEGDPPRIVNEMHSKKLTNEEKQYIKNNLKSKSVAQIATDLDRSEPAVRDFIKKENLTISITRPKLSTEIQSQIIHLCKDENKTVKQIQEITGVNSHRIKYLLKKYDIPFSNPNENYLNKQEKQYIRNNINISTIKQIAIDLGRAEATISKYLRTINKHLVHRYTQQELNFIKSLIPIKSYKEISSIVGIDTTQLSHLITRYNLKDGIKVYNPHELTFEEKEFIKANINTMSKTAISKALHRGKKYVNEYIDSL